MWPSTAELSTTDLVAAAANARGAPGRAREVLRATTDSVKALAEARATQAEAEAGTANDKIMTPLRVAGAMRARAEYLGQIKNDGSAQVLRLALPEWWQRWENVRGVQQVAMVADMQDIPAGGAFNRYYQSNDSYLAVPTVISLWLPRRSPGVVASERANLTLNLTPCSVGNRSQPRGPDGIMIGGVHLNRYAPEQVYAAVVNYTTPRRSDAVVWSIWGWR